MAWEYSDKVLQLFMDAVQGKAGTHMGEISDPDGFGEHGSIVCGDALRFFFRVKRDPVDPTRDLIIQARFLTFGCTSAIATSEALCALLEEQQKTPIEALQVTNQDLIEYLGGLPPEKIHCSVMGAEALQAAVIDWAGKRNVDLGPFLPEQMRPKEAEGRLVCKCFSVTEPYLLRKIKELDLHNIEQVTAALKAGGACRSCHYAPGGLQDLLDQCWGKQTNEGRSADSSVARDSPKSPQSPWQRGKKIEETIEREIRPYLQREGGDIELIDIKEDLVYCRLTGACSNCQGAEQTLHKVVEKRLQDQVDKHLRVIAL